MDNMKKILAETTITTEPIDDDKLGIVNTEYVAFKAALLLCPGFRELAEPVLGWPLLAVMPCRDRVYVVSAESQELVGRTGPFIVREYEQSGYPVSTEVFELSDNGIRAIAEFQQPERDDNEDEDEADADGMKTIEYRGGVVVFRIPAHWEEEYEDEGGGTFYDGDIDGGTFLLNTATALSEKPVTTHMVEELAQSRAQKEPGIATDMGNGNWLVECVLETEEDGDRYTVYHWHILNPVPPNHIRFTIFSYLVATDLIEDENAYILEELAMLNCEIRAATFATQIGE